MVLRATPVARAVAATPPWPALCASAATCNRPARSSSDGRTASNRSAMGFSSIIPPPYRDHGAARITQPLEAPTDALISGRRLVRKLSDDLGEYPGVTISISQPIANRVDELLSGVKAQIAIKLFGDDLKVLEEGRAIQEAIATVPGASDLQMEQISGE